VNKSPLQDNAGRSTHALVLLRAENMTRILYAITKSVLETKMTRCYIARNRTKE